MAEPHETYRPKAFVLFAAAVMCLFFGYLLFAPMAGMSAYFGIFLMGLAPVLNLCAFFSGIRALVTTKRLHWSLLLTLPGVFLTGWAVWVVIHL